MANKDKIVQLSKYQISVLYYKCKEGLTHAEIAELMSRDVNTIQYHMTKIYTILEIKKPGKSKDVMDSELKNEICPIIREMFNSYEDVKIWAPIIKDTIQEENEDFEDDIADPLQDESQPPYKPPPSVDKILKSAETRPKSPEIIEPPPPGIRRINWILIIGIGIIGLIILIFAIFLRPTRDEHPEPIITPTEMTVETSPIDGMVLIKIPAGEFKMGSARAEDPQAFDKELRQHIVYLDTYWIDQTEVTNAQYAMCVATGACTKPANNFSSTRDSYYDNNQYANYPVIFVSWDQADAYCAWAGRRLPTEAEWEKAARSPEELIYPWGNSFDGTLANYCEVNCDRPWKDNRFDDGYFDTSPVRNYLGGASVYGTLDMAGNVHEWVADWFAPYISEFQTNPTGPTSGQEKIIRGGSWGDDPDHIRSDVRSPIDPNNWMDFIGFRCAR